MAYINGKKVWLPSVVFTGSGGGGGSTPTLPAPTLTLDGDILTITDASGSVGQFDILVDGVVVHTVDAESDSGEDSGSTEEAKTQTLTVINSNNESEVATFTMPEGYTFEDFIGSEYDTSGGKFTLSEYGAVPTHRTVYYEGKTLGVFDIDKASGTFYYAGEYPDQTLTVINSNNPSETATFTMPEGYTFEQFIGSEYDTSGGKFTLSEYGAVPTHRTVYYDGKSLDGGIFDIFIASGTFYYAGEAAQITDLTGTIWYLNDNFPRPSSSTIWQVSFVDGNNNAYSRLRYAYTGVLDTAVSVSYYNSSLSSPWVSAYSGENGWRDESYRTITFTGGTDATNASLIAWLTEYGVLQPPEQTYTLSGKWVWKKYPSAKDIGRQAITFTSNGKTFESIGFSTPGITFDSEWMISYSSDGPFNDEHRIVDFGSTPQTVSKEFYDAFTDNAVQEISGSWLWNDDIDIESIDTVVGFNPTYVEVNFISNGINCIAMHFEDADGEIYYETDTGYFYVWRMSWLDQTYRAFTLNEPVSANTHAEFIMAVIDYANPT